MKKAIGLLVLLCTIVVVSQAQFSGDFKIINVNSHKALSIRNGSAATGAACVQMDFSNTPDQIWNIQSAGNGYYYIVGKTSGKVIDLQNGSTADGAAVQINDKNTSYSSQLWQINSRGFNQYSFINKASGKSISVSSAAVTNGATLIQWTFYSSSNEMKWILVAPDYDLNSPAKTTFSVNINGTTLKPYAQSLELSYTSFTLSKPGEEVKIEVNAEELTKFEFYPKNLGINPVVNYSNKKITLTLDGKLTYIPRKLVFKANDKWLAVFIELPEINAPQLSDTNVKNIMDFSPDTTGKTEQTSKLQNAINWMANNNEGKKILYFPKGKYITNPLFIGKNIQIYLHEGALIRSTSIPASDNPLITVDGKGSATFKLFGRGTIDGNGDSIAAVTGKRYLKLLLIKNCASITIEDVILQNQNNWTLSTEYSTNVSIENVKVVGSSNRYWTDAFDITSCKNYINNNSFAWSCDDNIAVMSGTTPTMKVVFNNLLGYTNCSGVRFGWDSKSNIEASEFNNCEWIQADLNAIAFHQPQNGCIFGRVAFNQCRMDSGTTIQTFNRLFTSDPENWGGEGGRIKMNSLEFRNCLIEKQSKTTYNGDATYKIWKIIYENTYIDSTLLTSKSQIENLTSSNVGAFEFISTDQSTASRDPFQTIRAETFNGQSGTVNDNCSEGGIAIGYIHDGDYLSFSNLDFGAGAKSFKARVASLTTGGKIELRLDSLNAKPVAVLDITNTGGVQTWQDFKTSIPDINGKHTLYLYFTGLNDYLFTVQSFQFIAEATSSISERNMQGFQKAIITGNNGKMVNVYIPTNEKIDSLEIYDVNGRKLYRGKSDLNNSIRLNINSGIYILKTTTSKGVCSNKFILE
jgi:hypothetical protein